MVDTETCPHTEILAYTEDGERFHACRQCGEIWALDDGPHDTDKFGY